MVFGPKVVDPATVRTLPFPRFIKRDKHPSYLSVTAGDSDFSHTADLQVARCVAECVWVHMLEAYMFHFHCQSWHFLSEILSEFIS